ncbi:hypothetical protein AB834_01715 [PVC group bacterium (ex Bugula neritina AB1)]|nr:hypothetical protein AB834_01715 [PVC group bacterium (ex Bugula neritina AB1)]
MLYTSYPEEETAQKMAASLVKKKWVACVHIYPKVKSVYTWEENLEISEESTVFFKTFSSHKKNVETFIIDNHPYSCPSVLSLPISSVNIDYLSWMRENLSSDN